MQLSQGHLSNQYLSWWHLSISGISQLLPTQFYQTLKVDSKKNCWLLILRTRSFYPIFVVFKKIFDPKSFWTLILWTKTFWGLTAFLPIFSLDPTLLGLKFFEHGLFCSKIFFAKNINNNNDNHNFNGFDINEINLVF